MSVKIVLLFCAVFFATWNKLSISDVSVHIMWHIKDVRQVIIPHFGSLAPKQWKMWHFDADNSTQVITSYFNVDNKTIKDAALKWIYILKKLKLLKIIIPYMSSSAPKQLQTSIFPTINGKLHLNEQQVNELNQPKVELYWFCLVLQEPLFNCSLLIGSALRLSRLLFNFNKW